MEVEETTIISTAVEVTEVEIRGDMVTMAEVEVVDTTNKVRKLGYFGKNLTQKSTRWEKFETQKWMHWEKFETET